MKNLWLFAHISLDGMAAGPNGEMDWIHVDEEIFDYVHSWVSQTTTALYGRNTYKMMESYWPTAGDKPNASRHDKEHSAWYMKAKKYVLSNSMAPDDYGNVHIINGDIVPGIQEMKASADTDIILFGSPGAGHSLLKHDLIDGFMLFVNPKIIGPGIPVFEHQQKLNLQMKGAHTFNSGVVALRYHK
ncbi:dihydrofolate reductase family protein [Chitinophaga sp. Cy-1792]|uniref:dihydrofolate reductase family protein n=1 Tax=Chitinophaga sp. Cy-1792 TaxID=2608339 RepID=UPI0014201EE1|nr:dihydrofolate reductase family protein [Chitinophaga sp. Cy-1792]NIG55564.1 dihydrofolate reductase family protein [Chitinophaga sp. Cy-1792]